MAATADLPFAFACVRCRESVPLVTLALGVTVACPMCGEPHTIQREWLLQLLDGDGARPRETLVGLPPATIGGTEARLASDEVRLPWAANDDQPTAEAASQQPQPQPQPSARRYSSGTIPLARPGGTSKAGRGDSITTMRSRREMMAQAETEAPTASIRESQAFARPAEPPPTEEASSAEAAPPPSSADSARFHAGVPAAPASGDSRRIRTGQRPADSGRYRGAYIALAPQGAPVSRDTGEGVRIEAAGQRLALRSSVPYAAMVGAYLAIRLTHPDEFIEPTAVLHLPAHTLLALFAGGLMVIAATAAGLLRGILMAMVGFLPMVFVLPSVMEASEWSVAVLLLMPVFIAVCYGACAAAATFATAPLPKALAGVTGFIIIGTQVSASIGEQGGLAFPPQAQVLLYILAIAMGIGPILALYNFLNPDEATARRAMIAHWVGYLLVPAAAFFFIRYSLLDVFVVAGVLLLAFGWVFAAGAGVRDLLIIHELRARGLSIRPGAVAAAASGRAAATPSRPRPQPAGPGAADTAYRAARQGADEIDDADQHGSGEFAALDAVPVTAEGPNLFGPVPDDNEAAETEDDAAEHDTFPTGAREPFGDGEGRLSVPESVPVAAAVPVEPRPEPAGASEVSAPPVYAPEPVGDSTAGESDMVDPVPVGSGSGMYDPVPVDRAVDGEPAIYDPEPVGDESMGDDGSADAGAADHEDPPWP